VGSPPKMTEALALRYRPTTFEGIVGQRLTAVVLSQMVATGSVPTGLLFAGASGSGKTTAARVLANALGGDVIEVDAASHGSVDDVRKMIESLKYSAQGDKRVVIYDEAHSMSKEAYNALLKTLEEPPAGTYFILVTTEPQKIPETVKGRLIEFTFNKLKPADIHDRLVYVVIQEEISISDPLLALFADRAEGSMRDALMLLDLASRAGIENVEQYRELTGESDVAPELVEALATGDASQIWSAVGTSMQRVPDPNQIAAALVQCLKEVLILRAGGQISISGARLALRQDLAARIEPERILQAMKILWDLRSKVRTTADPRGNLDLALVLVSEAFTRGKQLPSQAQAPAVVPKPPAPAPQRRLTLAEMKK
jgi:DNA polymerase-3 subunit gamma/tau